MERHITRSIRPVRGLAESAGVWLDSLEAEKSRIIVTLKRGYM